ncbi:hypothetical protein DSO57_1006760 [Entomophthora muscae]|uniref:Uncharacterized protein n=1 Tax=Entomophthora muscae TaxID=34485 RepID=A0ACC2RMC4_9FUNG|nr:hypothetical protein DSO57_1006760 [Entomophthora muscae]
MGTNHTCGLGGLWESAFHSRRPGWKSSSCYRVANDERKVGEGANPREKKEPPGEKKKLGKSGQGPDTQARPPPRPPTPHTPPAQQAPQARTPPPAQRPPPPHPPPATPPPPPSPHAATPTHPAPRPQPPTTHRAQGHRNQQKPPEAANKQTLKTREKKQNPQKKGEKIQRKKVSPTNGAKTDHMGKANQPKQCETKIL